jgi:phage tail-like protein
VPKPAGLNSGFKLAAFIPLGIEPHLSRNFLFEADGVPIGVFNEVSGLSVEIDTDKVREGGQNGYVHELPGRMEWPHITFKRGLTQSDNLFHWFEKMSGENFAGQRNKVERSTGAISIVDHLGLRLRSWNLRDVMPVKWSGPALSTSSNEMLMEELEIAHHGFSSESHLLGAL